MADKSSMIEDALQASRTLYRLVITGSVVTIVFALSLRSSSEIKIQIDSLEGFLGFDFSAYYRHVAANAQQTLQTWLQTQPAIPEELGRNFLTFEVDEIRRVLARPLLLDGNVSETKFSAPGKFTLIELNSLKGLYPLRRNLDMALPETAGLADDIKAFLAENGKTGARIQNVQLQTVDEYTPSPKASKPQTLLINLSFELITPGAGGAPIFERRIPAAVRGIPDSAFVDWLSRQHEARTFAKVTGDDVDWLPQLAKISRSQSEKNLAELFKDLNAEVQKESPENRSVDLFGTTVPGLLLIYAAPLVLIALMYQVLFHVSHLTRFLAEGIPLYSRFAWSPLSPDSTWHRESCFTLLLLPVGSILVFGIQFFRLDLLNISSGLFIVCSALGTGFLGEFSRRKLKMLRNSIGRETVVESQTNPV